MESCGRSPVVIDVNQVLQKHHKIMPNLLAAHALTGCDTVSCFSGIGKATVYKKLESFDDHIKLGDLSACLDEVTESCMGFVASLNGHAQGNALEAMRAEIFTWKPLAKGTSQQNLKVFLPQWRLSDPIVHVPIIKQHYGKPPVWHPHQTRTHHRMAGRRKALSFSQRTLLLDKKLYRMKSAILLAVGAKQVADQHSALVPSSL